MKIFVSNDFTGHWPVGTAAVVVARTRKKALSLIKKECKKEGLVFDGTLNELLIDKAQEQAIILNNGEY